MAISIYTVQSQNSVFIYMHYYACPHCDPDLEAHLSEDVIKLENCKHKKGLFNSSKKCKEEEYQCKTKKILICDKCRDTFVPSKRFMQEQKRKIKDG